MTVNYYINVRNAEMTLFAVESHDRQYKHTVVCIHLLVITAGRSVIMTARLVCLNSSNEAKYVRFVKRRKTP